MSLRDNEFTESNLVKLIPTTRYALDKVSYKLQEYVAIDNFNGGNGETPKIIALLKERELTCFMTFSLVSPR